MQEEPDKASGNLLGFVLRRDKVADRRRALRARLGEKSAEEEKDAETQHEGQETSCLHQGENESQHQNDESERPYETEKEMDVTTNDDGTSMG